MSDQNELTRYLADRPKMIGALFTLMLLLSPGIVVTAAGAGYPGP